jgi:lysophospholipase L1-like esterase
MQTSADAVIEAKPPRHQATMKRRAVFGLGACFMGQLGCAGKGSENATARRFTGTIHVAGDSTAAAFPQGDERVGWAAVLGELITDANVDNAARSGRSTKSYIDEGHLAALEARLTPGDLLLIQFGHNDEKPDVERHTDPTTTFRDNLRDFIARARQRGAVPVLLTPIARLKFSGARIDQTHGAFPDATRAVAVETAAPLVELTQRTTELFESLGLVKGAELFAPNDTTHTNLNGARQIARLVAQSLHDLQLL